MCSSAQRLRHRQTAPRLPGGGAVATTAALHEPSATPHDRQPCAASRECTASGEPPFFTSSSLKVDVGPA